MDLRKLLAAGTGVGIEIGAGDLRVVMARVRPSGATVLGSTTIAGFRERPAAAWGSEYAEFLKILGGSYLVATAILPRSEVIVRQIMLPGVSDRDLASAIQFQIDSLHPYGEDEVRHAWVRLGRSPAVLVVITRSDALDRYVELFEQAGVKLASLTVSASVLWPAVRLLSSPPAEGFLATAGVNGDLELYGESPARPMLSALLDAPAERSIPLAAAELRLPAENQPVSLPDVLPVPKQTPEGYDPSREALAYASALAGACPRLARSANLLPPELRSASSRAMFVPTAVLAVALVSLVAGVMAQGKLQERRYLDQLDKAIAGLELKAAKVTAAERATGQARARIQLLDGFRRRTQSDLEVLQELTKILPPPAWLTGLELTRDSANLAGEIEQAAPLLKTLDNSSLFRNSEFAIPIARTSGMEIFRIHTQREGAPK